MSISSRRWAAVVVLVVVAAGAVIWWVRASPGDDPFADYCAKVEENRQALGAALAAGPTTGLLRALPIFEDLAQDAPDDLRDEWSIVVERTTDLRDALTDADVDPATYDPEKPPEDLTDADGAAIEAAAVRLGSQETRAAFSGVSQQARDVCQSPLSL